MKRALPFVPLTVILLLICLIELFKPRELDWTPSFSAADKIPWGTYILRDMIGDLFPGDSIRVSDQSLYMALGREDTSSETNLLIINDSFRPDRLELQTLLKYVDDGNNVFISASNLSRELADSLGLSLGLDFARFDTAAFIRTGDSTRREFKIDGFERFVEFYDTSATEILEHDLEGHPTFVRICSGEGNFFVHLSPWVFTNYNILKGDNASYAAGLLCVLPPGTLIWDEYYKATGYSFRTPLAFILENSALRWAYYTMLFGVCVFILVEGKRRQRYIPVYAPLRNETMSFVGTLARLDVTFADITSRKTGVSPVEMKLLVNELRALDEPREVSNEQLMRLDRTLENFYNICKGT